MSDSIVPGSGGITFSYHPEKMRLFAYAAFWGMVIFAVICTKVLVQPTLDFDLEKESHLQDFFGYNNICVYWDYTPSRELTAMVYPLFEYSYLAYVILEHVSMSVAFAKGIVPGWMQTTSKILLPIKIILIAWFRMIFVNVVTVNILAHTIGFLGLQVCLCLVALENVLFLNATKVTYGWLGGTRRNTAIASWTYLVVLCVTTFFKMFFTTYHILTHDMFPGMTVFATKMIDRFWMLLIAVMPIIFASIHLRKEPALSFKIDHDKRGMDSSSNQDEAAAPGEGSTLI